MPEAVVRAFSKRRDEIEEVAAESGYTSARAHQRATLSTRRSKEYGVDASTLEARLRKEASSLGFGPEELAAFLGRRSGVEAPDSGDAVRLAGPIGLTKHSCDLYPPLGREAVSEHAGAGADAECIEALIDDFLASGLAQPLTPSPEGASAETVWRRDGSRTRNPDAVRWSTPELLELEQRIMDWGNSGFGVPVPVPDQLPSRRSWSADRSCRRSKKRWSAPSPVRAHPPSSRSPGDPARGRPTPRLPTWRRWWHRTSPSSAVPCRPPPLRSWRQPRRSGDSPDVRLLELGHQIVQGVASPRLTSHNAAAVSRSKRHHSVTRSPEGP